eukprot:scaffold118244_cov32-Tisochrysis_lutea.AAC.1
MAKIKVRDNRGQARKKAKIAAYGKMRRVQKVGANKLTPAVQMPALLPARSTPAKGPSSQQQSHRSRQPHNPYAHDTVSHMLLLGEGDLSFAASLATLWGECTRLVATTLQSERESLAQADVEDNIETVRACGGTVLFGVDATRLKTPEAVGRRKGFDRIIFNFPLVSGGLPKDTPSATSANQALLREIFGNTAAGGLLCPDGELHVTIPRGQPYEQWGLPTLAKLAGLRVKCAIPFDAAAYPGYRSDIPHINGGALTYALVKVGTRAVPTEEVKKRFGGSAKEMNKQRRKKPRKP